MKKIKTILTISSFISEILSFIEIYIHEEMKRCATVWARSLHVTC